MSAQTAFHVLSHDPKIVMVVWEPGERHWILRALLDRVAGQAVNFIFNFWWFTEDDNSILEIKRSLREFERMYPHRYYFLCNTEEQHRLFWDAGLDCVFCNQNSLLDERIFDVRQDVSKKYDAVYSAQMARFKRHHLAARVDNLALITYFDGTNDCLEHYAQTQQTLSKATWINRPYAFGKNQYLDSWTVARHLNEARTGLCLSEVEGSMYASMEYLLCGLPVVSTRSMGGRDEFFDDGCARIVESRASAVRAGVEEMVSRRLDPQAVRARTLAKARPHRERFISLVQDIHDDAGAGVNFAERWDDAFVNKMLTWQEIDNIGRLLPEPDRQLP